jgi:hypothetical protein
MSSDGSAASPIPHPQGVYSHERMLEMTQDLWVSLNIDDDRCIVAELNELPSPPANCPCAHCAINFPGRPQVWSPDVAPVGVPAPVPVNGGSPDVVIVRVPVPVPVNAGADGIVPGAEGYSREQVGQLFSFGDNSIGTATNPESN